MHWFKRLFSCSLIYLLCASLIVHILTYILRINKFDNYNIFFFLTHFFPFFLYTGPPATSQDVFQHIVLFFPTRHCRACETDVAP